MNEKIISKLEVIPLDAIIDTQINGGTVSRLHQLLLAHCQTNTPERLSQIMQELKTREPVDGFEYNLITILTLIEGIEEDARKQGKTQMADVPQSPVDN